MKKITLLALAVALPFALAQSALPQDKQADFNKVRRQNNAKAEAKAREAFAKRHKDSPHRRDSQGNRNQHEFNRVREENNAKAREEARKAFAKGRKKTNHVGVPKLAETLPHKGGHKKGKE